MWIILIKNQESSTWHDYLSLLYMWIIATKHRGIITSYDNLRFGYMWINSTKKSGQHHPSCFSELIVRVYVDNYSSREKSGQRHIS